MSDYELPKRETLKAGAGPVSVAVVGLQAAEPASCACNVKTPQR